MFNPLDGEKSSEKYILLASILASSQFALAQDSVLHEKAIACTACHGLNGISVADNFPNLAGQKAKYLVTQLSAFKDGSRKNVLMNAIAEHLSSEDISELAEFFSELSVGLESQASEFSTVTLDQTKVGFPVGYGDTFTQYSTANRADNKQVRYLYANDAALSGAKDKGSLPDGSVIVMEVNKAKLDALGDPVLGDDGFYEKDSLAGYAVMEKANGWGDDIPETLRNADWNYAFFTAEKTHKEGINQAACLACHRPLESGDFMFSSEALRTAAAN